MQSSFDSPRTPAVTVIIPVFNGANYLREAIGSVFAQTFADYELVVVDDGSTDESWALIQSYGERLRGFRKQNGGVASALNLGIANARGRWIAWLSHDDLFLPTKVEKQVAFLIRSPQFKACYTDYFVADAAGRILRGEETPWYPRAQAMRALFGRSYIGGSTMLIERTCFDAVGAFSEKWRYTQDTEMWLRMLRRFEIGRVPEKLAVERSHPGQGRHRADIMRAETQAMYTQFFDEAGLTGVFPDHEGSVDDPRALARALTWFGDTMAVHRRWFAFADEQYRRSVRLWSSWRNASRWRLAIGAQRLFLPLRLYYTALGRFGA
jgi:glycosyltransferase involved in cell wall biosynthesis